MFTSALLKCDIFGYVPHFQIHKKKTYQTYFGSVFSIITITLIIYAIWHFGKEIIYKVKPSLIVTQYKDADPLRINFTDENFVIALGLQNADYSLYLNESIYTMRVKHHLVTRNNGSLTDTTTDLDIIKCSEKNITVSPDYFQLQDLASLYCLKNGLFYIEGEFGREIWSYVEFMFVRCQNSTKNNNSCQANEEIQRRLDGGYFGGFVTSNDVAPSHYMNPLMTFGINIFTTFSVRAYRDVWFYLKTIQVNTDKGWLMDEPTSLSTYSIESYREMWDFRNTDDVFFIGLI